MKFSIEKAVLSKAVAQAQSVVERRNTIPILSNVHIVGSAKDMVLSGTDLDVWIERHVAVADGAPLATTVDAHVLASIVAKLPGDGLVTLKLADAKLSVSCGRAKFSLMTLPVDDFPTLPAIEGATGALAIWT